MSGYGRGGRVIEGKVADRRHRRAELDAQYNLRAAVPEHGDYFDRWARRSAAARERLPCRLDVAYGDTPAETLDIFTTSRPGAPVHLFIHGGYWQAMDKSDFSFVAEGLAPAGCVVAVLNYALAPRVGMDEIVRQSRAAVAWLWRNVGRHGGDPARIHVSGHSAGGHLAAMAMITDWPGFAADLPPDPIKGGCAISGLFDLEPIRRCYLNEVLGMDAATAARNSPIRHVPASAPPLILALGEAETDEYHRQQADFAEVWRAAGHSLRLVLAPGLNHFAVVEELADPRSPLTRSVVEQMSL